MVALVRKGKPSAIKLKSSDKSEEEGATRALERAKAAKATAKTPEEKARHVSQIF